MRLARARLPAGLRGQVYDREWVPELQHIPTEAELFPLTRLLTGLRYAAGGCCCCGPGRSPRNCSRPLPARPDSSAARRLAVWSAGALHALVRPASVPSRVRLFVAGVTGTAAAAAGTAADVAAASAPDLGLFSVLVACGLAAQRGVRPHGPLHHDLTGIWLLPAAVPLPPLYAITAAAAIVAIQERRHRVVAVTVVPVTIMLDRHLPGPRARTSASPLTRRHPHPRAQPSSAISVHRPWPAAAGRQMTATAD